jgi:1-acyl-sn-glycerol-3-phosphate acyltransferase
MRHELRTSFRRVCWVGAWPSLPPETPVVIYANHHHFYDGHLIWLLTKKLDRPGITWMDDWDRFPFFAAVGAYPFPHDDPRRRRTTLRQTARLFRDRPNTMLAYFPEGTLHRPAEGILPFSGDVMQRMGRLFPSAAWWPLAINVTWWGDAQPTALMSGGPVSANPPSEPHTQLQTLWRALRETPSEPTHTLLDGRRSPSEIWSFTFARGFFKRYL